MKYFLCRDAQKWYIAHSIIARKPRCLLARELIEADDANQSGYFENRSIVDKQEKLLQELGYWWPTDRTSYGIPQTIASQKI